MYEDRYNNLLEKLVELSKCWNETEKINGDETLGDCAIDLNEIIESESEQM